MKKLFYLTLLVLILCCFVACGSPSTDTSKNDYENSESELSWEDEMAMEQKKWEDKWIATISDTWHPRSSDLELGDVIINSDGTLTFKGETYPYKFEYVGEESFSCYAYDGDTIKYSISYTKADPKQTNFEDRFEKLSIMVPEGENSYTTANGGGMFYREASYEAIPITAENWNTYFELAKIKKEITNDFGELEGFYYEYLYQIKEEYNNRVNCNMSDVVFEVQTKTCSYNYTFDVANKTYTLTERVNDREEIDTNTVEFRAGHYSSFPDISYLSLWISPGCNMEADDDYCNYYLEEATVLRTTGTLYLFKE